MASPHSDVRDNRDPAASIWHRAAIIRSSPESGRLQAADTVLIGQGATNETRLRFFQCRFNAIANTAGLTVTGVAIIQRRRGSSLGHTFDTQNNYELQNYTFA